MNLRTPAQKELASHFAAVLTGRAEAAPKAADKAQAKAEDPREVSTE